MARYFAVVASSAVSPQEGVQEIDYKDIATLKTLHHRKR